MRPDYASKSKGGSCSSGYNEIFLSFLYPGECAMEVEVMLDLARGCEKPWPRPERIQESWKAVIVR